MNDRQRRIQGLLNLLADRSRFRMLCVLAEGPLHVSELAVRVGLSQSCATRHVQALAAAEAVACRRDGKRVMVHVRRDEEVVRTLIAWVGDSMSVDESIRSTPPARPQPRGPRAHRTRPEEVPLAPAPDSGTPPPASAEAPEPMPPARIRALEDFLL